MENASKALIIAGSILTAIIIISLGIMIFNNMSRPVIQEASLNKQQIMSFNSKITPYLGENISGSQVNALMQLVRTINAKAEKEQDEIKKITVNNSTNIKRYTTGVFYEVTGEYNERGLITILTVKEHNSTE